MLDLNGFTRFITAMPLALRNGWARRTVNCIVLLVAKLNLGACHHGIAEKCRSESNA